MSDIISTEEEYEALLVEVSEQAEPAIVIDEYNRPWIITETEFGDFWAWSWRDENGDTNKDAETLTLPLQIVRRPPHD